MALIHGEVSVFRHRDSVLSPRTSFFIGSPELNYVRNLECMGRLSSVTGRISLLACRSTRRLMAERHKGGRAELMAGRHKGQRGSLPVQRTGSNGAEL